MANKEPKMSNYCKAYYLEDLRKFEEWKENPEVKVTEKKTVDGKETEVTKELEDKSIVYVHDSYVVTVGTYVNENVLFENVTPEWKSFCEKDLKFEIPEWQKTEEPEKEASQKEEPEEPEKEEGQKEEAQKEEAQKEESEKGSNP